METDQQALSPESLPFRWKMAWVVFFLLLLEVGLRLQNPGLMADDSGEMAAAAVCLGLPHPPGYPLYSLIGHLVCGIPLGSPAFRLNMFSMCVTLLAAWVLLSVFRWVWPRGEHPIRREVVFGLCVLFLVTIRVVVSQSLTAKGLVYTATLLLSILWMEVGLRKDFGRGKKLLSATFLWGCGLAIHWPTVLLWGLGLVVLASTLERREGIKEGLLSLSLGLMPVSLFLYLPFRAVAAVPVLWGRPRDLTGFLWVIRRELSFGTEPLLRDAVLYRKSFVIVMKAFGMGSVPLLALLGLGALLWLLIRRDVRVVWLTVSFLPVFLGILIVPRPDSFYLLDVYLVSLCGFLTLGVCLGLKAVLRGLSRSATCVGLAILTCASIAWGWKVGLEEDKSRYTLAGDLGLNILQTLPKDSFFLAEGDLSVFPVWYDQAALGLRPDVAMVPPHFFQHPWGWTQAIRMRPILGDEDLSRTPPAIQWTALRRAFGGAPVGAPGGLYLSMDRTKLLTWDPGWVRGAVPAGLVLSATTRPESDGAFLDRQREIRRHRRMRTVEEPEGSRGLDFVSRQVLRYYSDDSFQDALWLEGRGRLRESLASYDAGFRIDADEPSAFSGAARVLGKAGYPEASVELCRMGLRLDPTGVVLLRNLSVAERLSGAEDTRGKIERYKGLLRQARAFRWDFLFGCFMETADRLTAEKGWKSHDGT